MQRYQHIVRISLFGHSHKFELSLTQQFYSNEEKFLGLTLGTGSLTPNYNRNPTFSVVELDAEYMIPLNIKTYYLNLTQANDVDAAYWSPLQDIKKDYNLTDLSPQSIGQFAKKIKENELLARTYKYFQDRHILSPAECNEQCRLEVYCDITNTDYFNTQICKGYQENDFLHDPFPAVMNIIHNNWITENGLFD